MTTTELAIFVTFAIIIGAIGVKVAGSLLKIALVLAATCGVLYILLPDVVGEIFRQLAWEPGQKLVEKGAAWATAKFLQ